MVWMRAGATSDWRKPWGKTTSKLYKGTYTLTITYNWPTNRFKGRKYFVIASTNSFGGKNYWLAICYLTIGTI